MEEKEKLEEQAKINSQFEGERKTWLMCYIVGICTLIVGITLNYQTDVLEKITLIGKILTFCLIAYLTIKSYLNYKHFEYSKGESLTNYVNGTNLHLTDKGKLYLNPFDRLFGANSFNLRKLKYLTIVGSYFFKKKIVNFSNELWWVHNPKQIERLIFYNINLDYENDVKYLAERYSNLKDLRLTNCKFNNLSDFLDFSTKRMGSDNKPLKFINNLERLEILQCEISNDYWKPSEKLYTVKINNSKIKSIPKAINESITCYEADFSNNEITFVALPNSRLRKLALQNNKIKAEDINGLPKTLDSLNLSNNPLKVFPEIIFESKDIRYIDLSNCEIEVIENELIEKVKINWGIKRINLKGNPLTESSKTKLYQELPNIVEFD